MRLIKLISVITVFFTVLILGIQITLNSQENQSYKKDSAEIHHFKYGLFSVDQWKLQISEIISQEIDQLYIGKSNEKMLKGLLENQLKILIDQIYLRIKKNSGSFKQSIIEGFVDIKEIKKGIPTYADAMMKELSSPKSEGKIKELLKEKITLYMDKTLDSRPTNYRDSIIAKYQSSDFEDVKRTLDKKIARKNHVIAEQSSIMILLALIIFVIEATTRKPLSSPQYFLLTFTLLTLMIVGVITPMIDMEAKISSLSFILFDHSVHFDNQILYFQSKSVLDVFWVMISHKDLQMKLVGVLVVSFSVFFPILKMLSSLAYYYDYCRAKQYKIIQFFVLKSGKWSMADVLVVAMFMAYIGFNGVIDTQLKSMGESAQGVDLITTNGTSLQPGFYIFLTYTLLAMFLAGLLKQKPNDCK